VRRPFQERRRNRGDKLRRPVPTLNAQPFSKFKAAAENLPTRGTTWARVAFPVTSRGSPIPPERAVTSVKEPGATSHPVLYFSEGRAPGHRSPWNVREANPLDEYERAGDDQADRAVFIRFVSSDADAQRDQLLRIPFTAAVVFVARELNLC